MSIKFDRATRNGLKSEFADLVERAHQLNPVLQQVQELDSYAVYSSTLPEDVRRILEEGMRIQRALSETNTPMTFIHVTTAGKIRLEAEFPDDKSIAGRWEATMWCNFTDYQPTLLSNSLPVVPEENPYFNTLRDYVRGHLIIREVTRKANEMFSRILQRCTTVGQMHTVFPAFSQLLPNDRQQALKAMRTRSRRPTGLDVTREEVKWLTQFVARCSLLPRGNEVRVFEVIKCMRVITP